MENLNFERSSVKDLEIICKQYGIHYYRNKKHLKKDEMIEEINKFLGKEKEDTLAKEFSRKDQVLNADLGTIIAFVDNNGKARTGAIINKLIAEEIVVTKTEFGRIFKVPFDKVLWVRKENNTRWPKNVYKMLKGITANE